MTKMESFDTERRPLAARAQLAAVMAVALAGLLLTAAATVAAPPDAGRFLSGLQAYKSGDYARAVSDWKFLADNGLQNGKLFYNLGNACLKDGRLGEAVLWYERALKLIPDDPDLNFNYEYARSLTRDAPEGGPSPLARTLFFWKYLLSGRTIAMLAIGFNLAFWLLAAGWQLTRRPALRRAALCFLAGTLLFGLTAAFNYYQAGHHRQAVVLPQQVVVRSGLEAASTELFRLHAGARVEVLKTLKHHCQIRFSEDKIGWVEQSAIGLI